MTRIRDHEALTFDVYGTLIDWEPSITAFFEAWAETNGVEADDVAFLDAFDDARTRFQAIRPALLYPEVLSRAYGAIAERWNRPVDVKEQEEFSRSAGTWPPYGDTIDSLQHLRRHFRMGCVSNIDDRSLDATLAALGVEWDFTVTAERVGAYKPDLPHFVHMISQCGRLGVGPDRILHVGQSLRADVAPAARLGLKMAWINRPGRRLGVTEEDADGGPADFVFASLADLVEAHREEL